MCDVLSSLDYGAPVGQGGGTRQSLPGASLGQQTGGQARGAGCGLTKAGKDRAVGALDGAEMVSCMSESEETLGTVARTSETLEMCLDCLSSNVVWSIERSFLFPGL